jgi:hypothetical protein
MVGIKPVGAGGSVGGWQGASYYRHFDTIRDKPDVQLFISSQLCLHLQRL